MVKITERYGIDADKNCFIVVELPGYEDRNGKISYKAVAYNSTFTQALEVIIRKEQRRVVAENEVASVKKVLEEFRKIEAKLRLILKEEVGGA